jgi:hypothetical protein
VDIKGTQKSSSAIVYFVNQSTLQRHECQIALATHDTASRFARLTAVGASMLPDL